MSTLSTKLRRDIGRQRGPFVAVTITVLLGVALFGASYDAYLNLTTSYERVFDELQLPDLWVTGGDTATFATDAAALDGVAAVATRVSADLPMAVGDSKLFGRVLGVTGEIADADTLADALADARTGGLAHVALLAGRAPGAGEVAAEQHMAGTHDLVDGDTVTVTGATGREVLTVTGAVASGEYLWPAPSRQQPVVMPQDFGVLLAPAALAEQLAGHGPNQALVRLADGADAEATLSALRSLATSHGATEVYDWDEQPSNALLGEDITGFAEMAFLFPLLFLSAAGMAAYTVLARRIRAERAIIGMLRACGTPRKAVLRHYRAFGLVAGLAGALPGVLLGLWLARAMTSFYVGFIDLPITATAFHPETVVAGIAFGILTGTLAARRPARDAAATPPAEAMRGIVPATGGRTSLLERAIPGSRHLSARWRLVLRSIDRNRRRTAMTMGAIVLSLLLVLVSWSMIDTINAMLDTQFGDHDRSDATVELADAGALAALRDLDGVTAAEPLTLAPVTLDGPGGSYATVLQAVEVDSALRSFPVVDGAPDLSGSGILVGVAARDLTGVDVGDDVTLRLSVPAELAGLPEDLTLSLHTTVAGFVREALGTYVYVDRQELAASLGLPDVPVTGALVAFADGVDRHAMRTAISDLDGVLAYRDTNGFRELIEDATALLIGFVTIMLIVGGVLAGAVIFTTVSVSISERTTEVATLRATGVPIRTIARLITTENLLVALLGVAPGIVLGILGGRAMMATYGSDQFAFDFAVAPTTVVVSSLAILGVAALSQIPGLRSIRRLDLAATVRERSD